MSIIVETIDVHAPVSATYDQWTQFESFPEFMDGVTEVRQLDDVRLHWVTRIGGMTREFDATITEQIPDRRIAWRSDDGPDHAGEITFDQVDAATTRVTARMVVDPEGFVENAADKAGVLSRRVKGDLKRFREFLEDRGGMPTGAWRGQVGSTFDTTPERTVADSAPVERTSATIADPIRPADQR
ncbi:Polyketide cyclase / dehydrase and lipid transport [Actinokineospora iranica]|uniref:Polyketide cyclase / dehydrase and lipid transport n=1 Tax=Actinokineospora iranica TaxID=1271860 RepID=A0A1G6XE95_9PSEU|nr:Polyketide cyclase / dehydrase and lipid transport [Actinokineospora iranica]